MVVYRICLEKWASKLQASGNEACWNTKGKAVIYTASSRALACLENLVHRGGEGLNGLFKTVVIEIPDNIEIAEIDLKELLINWVDYKNYSKCQRIGDEWITNMKSCVLKVPSSIIPNEHNYIINTKHPDFNNIRIINIEDFIFDSRVR
jgi:RES domain-containing protein